MLTFSLLLEPVCLSVLSHVLEVFVGKEERPGKSRVVGGGRWALGGLPHRALGAEIFCAGCETRSPAKTERVGGQLSA